MKKNSLRKTFLISLSTFSFLNTFANYLFSSVAHGETSPAQVFVQRTTTSLKKDYLEYLKKENLQTFVDGYIQTSASMELKTPLLEQCLEEMYLGAPFEDSCFESIKSLTSRPLNKVRREVLISFLQKLKKGSKSKKNFYESFHSGLTKVSAGREIKTDDDNIGESKVTKALEMNAWRKAISKKIDLEESALLVNGIKVMNIDQWVAPDGIFQWTLVTNTHEPIIRLSSFAQFATDSVKSLEALNPEDCKKISEREPQKYSLVKVEVFESRKCVVKYDIKYMPTPDSGHLGRSQNIVNLEEKSHRNWIWTSMLIVGVGVAMSLKDKNVQVSLPSLQ